MSTKRISRATIEIDKSKTEEIACDVVITAAGASSKELMSKCDSSIDLDAYFWLDPTTLVETTNPFDADGVYQFVCPENGVAPNRFSAIATDRGRAIIAGGLGTQMQMVRNTIDRFLPAAEIIERLNCNRAKFSRDGRTGNTRLPDVVSATELRGTTENLLFAYPAKMSLFLRCGELAMQSLSTICERKSRVLIIGGGVAGVEIARRTAQAGYQVTLVESKNRLFTGQSSRLGNQGRLWRIFGIARGEDTDTVLNHIEEAQELTCTVPQAVRQNVCCKYWVHQERDKDFLSRLEAAAKAAWRSGIQVKWNRNPNPAGLSGVLSCGYVEYDFGATGNGDGAVDAEGIRDWLLQRLDKVTIHYNSELISVS